MNRSRFGIVAAAIMLAALAMPVAAGSSPKLHPSGFGEHSYASWKAGEGLPDSIGNKNQALYFQKMTSTETYAAGVAVFQNLPPMSTADLELEFWWRNDGHCGAGAPRFNVRVENALGIEQTYFVGCAAMVPGATVPGPDGTTYQQRTFRALYPGTVDLPLGTVTGLAIVFDEGTDDGEGVVYLDDIRVNEYLWTSASDNGGGNTPVDAVTLEAMWGAPLSTLLR